MQQDLERNPCAFHFLLIPRASEAKSVALRSLIHKCGDGISIHSRRNNSVTLFRFTETDGELSGRNTIMKTKSIGFWAIAAVMATLVAAPVANSQTERFSASLSGAEEVPPINTTGTGAFEMTIQQVTITFSLTFSDLSSPLSVAHLHFAPSKVAGGVMIFLCGGG